MVVINGLELGVELARFDGSNWTGYDTSNSGLPDNWVHAVAIDGSDNIWSGTWLGGLGAYREGGVFFRRSPTSEKTNGKAAALNPWVAPLLERQNPLASGSVPVRRFREGYSPPLPNQSATRTRSTLALSDVQIS